MISEIYSNPKYYDLAFGWDISEEADFYENAFSRYSKGEIKDILELGCGSGRFLFEFTRRSYYILGMDINPEALRYVKSKAQRSGMSIYTVLADMIDFSLDETFDAAFCAVGTFRYILDDEDILKHFTSVSRVLRKGGIYIIDFSLVSDYNGKDEYIEAWTSERDGIRVEAMFKSMGNVSIDSKREDIEFVLQVKEGGREFELREEGQMRVYNLADFSDFIERSGYFEIAEWILGTDIEAITDKPDESNRLMAILRRI